MSVRAAQEEIDSAEFAEWRAYHEVDPFGEDRADLRSGIVASVVANANRTKGRAFKPGDFMPDFDRMETGQQSVEEMQARIGIALGVKRHGNHRESGGRVARENRTL